MNNIKHELANVIRNKTDDELLSIVMDRAPATLVTKPVISRRPRAKPLTNGGSADVDLVYKAINGRTGVSCGEIADITKLPRSRVRKCIAELKSQKRVHQAGERRFTRYAITKEIAARSSKLAHNASPK